jgi:hypothetical protein
MPFSRKNRVVLLILTAFVISGCADHMNHRDTVTLGSGNAVEANTAVHVSSPWPPHVNNTNVQE